MTNPSVGTDAHATVPMSLAEQAHAAQLRWAREYALAHRKQRRASWTIAIILAIYVTPVAYQLDTHDSLVSRSAVALLCAILPLECARLGASDRIHAQAGTICWVWAWGTIALDALFAIPIIQAGHFLMGITYLLAIIGVGCVLSYGLHIPLDPSINWDLINIEQLALVRTANGGDPYEQIITDYKKAEEIAAAWLRRFGYWDAHVTPDRQDDGIDVESRGAVAQVKNWRTKRVGIADVQRLAGSAETGQACFFFSASGYTRAASRWAAGAGHRVSLFIMQINGHIVACNYRAKWTLWKAPRHIPVAQRRSIRRGDTIFDMFSCVIFALGAMLFGWVTIQVIVTDTNTSLIVVISLAGITATMLLGFKMVITRPLRRLADDVANGRRPDVWKAFTPVPYKRDEGLPSDQFTGYPRDLILRTLIGISEVRTRYRSLRRIISAKGYR